MNIQSDFTLTFVFFDEVIPTGIEICFDNGPRCQNMLSAILIQNGTPLFIHRSIQKIYYD